jgi:cell division protein FtsB
MPEQITKILESTQIHNYLIFIVIFIVIVHIAVSVVFIIKYRKRQDKFSKQITNIENSFVNFLMELEAKNLRLKKQNTELKEKNKKLKKSK